MFPPALHSHVYPPGELIPGTVYRVRRKLGEGGMGVVYEVEDTSIGKIYVVKTVLIRHAGKEAYATLTLNEARLLAKFRHRNIVDVITAGTTADDYHLAYFVMERLEGCTLATLRGVKVPMGFVWQIGRELLDALQYVHHPKDGRPGIVHRDVKPENIFLAKVDHEEAGASMHRVKLLDFGIGAVLGHRPEGFWGSARYAAPEQVALEPVTPKTDLYATALILFELLSGRHPFDDAKTVEQILEAHLVRIPPRLSTLMHLPKAVDDCIDAALSKNPDRRPRDAHKMISALAELRNVDGRFSERQANTTIQDLNTMIDRHTQTGYEAYASSSPDTIDGMTTPPVDLERPLEVAYADAASLQALAIGPTLPVGLAPRAGTGAKGGTVPMAPAYKAELEAPAQQPGFREAPTRSLRKPHLVRAAHADTEELTEEAEDLLAGLCRSPMAPVVRTAEPARSIPISSRRQDSVPIVVVEAPAPTSFVGSTSAAVERGARSTGAIQGDDEPSRRVLLTGAGIGMLIAGVIVVFVLRRPAAASDAGPMATAVTASTATTTATPVVATSAITTTGVPAAVSAGPVPRPPDDPSGPSAAIAALPASSTTSPTSAPPASSASVTLSARPRRMTTAPVAASSRGATAAPTAGASAKSTPNKQDSPRFDDPERTL